MTADPDRRLFLKFLGAGFTGVAVGTTPLGPLAAQVQARPGVRPDHPFAFTPIAPSSADDLVLPPEFTYDIVAQWGDRLPGTNARVGYNADFTAFLPLVLDGSEGLLCVNHEYVSTAAGDEELGVYTQSFPIVIGRPPRVDDEMHDVGVSVLHVRRDAGGRWRVADSRLTRRYDARSPMAASGPALQRARNVGGTLANCSGCHTPWNTVLTCEENYQSYVPDAVDTSGRGTIGGRFGMEGSLFGWVVEIDPHDPAWMPVKHTMLGRFRHENVAVRTTDGQPAVAYMGDDRTDGHVYRFVSEGRYVAGGNNRGTLLSRGHLYAAVFHPDGTGEWRELTGTTRIAPTPRTRVPEIPRGATTLGQVYSDLGAIVTDAFRASNLAGATPTGRPEDVEIHPIDGSVYIAFTANATLGADLFSNPYGEIWRIVEEGDGTGARFTWMRWRAGGPNDAAQAGRVFAAPDNLSFDPLGNLWVVTDIATVRLNEDARYTTFQNNGMFFVPTSGTDAGVAAQFASGPCECELAGPSWTPNRDTLFLSVQHPGEAHGIRTAAMTPPRGSNWPSRRLGEPPRPAVVSVRRR